MHPILVHVHIFYQNLWQELADKIKNIPYPFDLFITIVEKNQNLQKKILDDFPDAKIEVVANRGFDVGPFVHIINKVNLDNYSYIIKLHTKNDCKPHTYIIHSYNMSFHLWRKHLLNFMGKKKLLKILKEFEKRPTLGMVGHYKLITNKRGDEIALQKCMELNRKLGFKNNDYTHVGGTMFIARANIFKPLQKLNLQLSDFEEPTLHQSQLAHAIEGLLGVLVTDQGYTIEDVTVPKFYQYLAYRCTRIRKIYHARIFRKIGEFFKKN